MTVKAGSLPSRKEINSYFQIPPEYSFPEKTTRTLGRYDRVTGTEDKYLLFLSTRKGKTSKHKPFKLKTHLTPEPTRGDIISIYYDRTKREVAHVFILRGKLVLKKGASEDGHAKQLRRSKDYSTTLCYSRE
ncbi:hypothetical protein ACFLQN_02930 [Candidatus Aenigmatarchaeota archaeon]